MLPSKEWEEMFTPKEWLFAFIWMNFRNPVIVNIRNQEVGMYDISTKDISSFTPDFRMVDGKFDYRQYCICLIKKSLELSHTDFRAFLKYQCDLMEDPFEWLCNFDKVLEFNENFELLKPCMNRLKLLRIAIEEECARIVTARSEKTTDFYSDLDLVKEPKEMYHIKKLLTKMEALDDYRAQISICKELRATYLREVEGADKESVFVRLIDQLLDAREEIVSKSPLPVIWHGSAKALARHHVLNNMIRGKSGKFIKSRNKGIEARWVCDRYRDINGGLFNAETIQTGIGKVVREIGYEIDPKNQ